MATKKELDTVFYEYCRVFGFRKYVPGVNARAATLRIAEHPFKKYSLQFLPSSHAFSPTGVEAYSGNDLLKMMHFAIRSKEASER